MIIPGTAKELLNLLITEHHYSIQEIACAIKSSPRTLLKILAGDAAFPKTSLKLLKFYLQISSVDKNQQEKVDDSRLNNDKFPAMDKKHKPVSKTKKAVRYDENFLSMLSIGQITSNYFNHGNF